MFPWPPKVGGGPGGGGGIVGSGMRRGAPGIGGGGGIEDCPICCACCASKASVLRQRSPPNSPSELLLPSRFFRCLSFLLASRSAAASSSFSLLSVTCLPSLCILTLTETGGEATPLSRLLRRFPFPLRDGEPFEIAEASAPPASAGPRRLASWWRRWGRPLGELYNSDPVSDRTSACGGGRIGAVEGPRVDSTGGLVPGRAKDGVIPVMSLSE